MWGLKMVRKLDTVHPQPRLKRLASLLLTYALSAVYYHVFNRLSLIIFYRLSFVGANRKLGILKQPQNCNDKVVIRLLVQ